MKVVFMVVEASLHESFLIISASSIIFIYIYIYTIRCDISVASLIRHGCRYWRGVCVVRIAKIQIGLMSWIRQRNLLLSTNMMGSIGGFPNISLVF